MSFAIHSPALLFRGETPQGKTLDFVVSRESQAGRVRFFGLQVDSQDVQPGGAANGSLPVRNGMFQDAAKLRQDWKLRVMQAIQDAKKAGLISPKGGFYHKEVVILDALLDQAPANVAEDEFRRICANPVRDRWDSEDELDKSYDHVLMVAFFYRSSERKDRQRLTTLLCHHCPQYLGYAASEFYLVSTWPESIECFFDCYTAAKSAGVQKNVVSCLGRAFPALRDRFPADREFVQEARNWYMSNRSNLQINYRYVHVAAQPPPEPGLDVTNLFLYKPK